MREMYRLRKIKRNMRVCALKGYSEYGSRSRMQSATKLVQIGVSLLDNIIARHILT